MNTSKLFEELTWSQWPSWHHVTTDKQWHSHHDTYLYKRIKKNILLCICIFLNVKKKNLCHSLRWSCWIYYVILWDSEWFWAWPMDCLHNFHTLHMFMIFFHSIQVYLSVDLSCIKQTLLISNEYVSLLQSVNFF